jgi:hypothetical protein
MPVLTTVSDFVWLDQLIVDGRILIENKSRMYIHVITF